MINKDALLRTIRDVHAVIRLERTTAGLFYEVCATLLHTRGYLLACVTEPGSDGQAAILVPGLDLPPAAIADLLSWKNPVGAALNACIPFTCQNIAEEHSLPTWRLAATSRGIASFAAVPVTHRDDCYGILLVCSGHPGAFDEREMDLLTELASDLAHACRSIEAEHECDRLKAGMRHTRMTLTNNQTAVTAPALSKLLKMAIAFGSEPVGKTNSRHELAHLAMDPY